MTGREERQKKVENRIMTKLEKFEKNNTQIVKGDEVSPKYMKQFYYTICNRGRDELGTSMNTRYLYVCAITNFLNYLKRNGYDIISEENFNDIKKSEIERYITTLRERKRNRGNTKTNSGSYIATQIHAIKAFFEFLYDDGYVDADPTFRIKIPKANKDLKITTLTDEEIQEVVNIINSGVMERGGQWKERDMAIVMLGLRTGMRISEIVELNISDIDFEKREIIIVGKGNKKRKIYLTEKMIDDLKSWIELRKEILYNT